MPDPLTAMVPLNEKFVSHASLEFGDTVAVAESTVKGAVVGAGDAVGFGVEVGVTMGVAISVGVGMSVGSVASVGVPIGVVAKVGVGVTDMTVDPWDC